MLKKTYFIYFFSIVALQYFTFAQSQHRQTLNVNFFTPFENKVKFTIFFTHKQFIMDECDIIEGLH